MNRPGLWIAAAVGLLFAARPALAQPTFEVGSPFPDFVLPSLDGGPMSITTFRGKRVALIVFASW